MYVPPHLCAGVHLGQSAKSLVCGSLGSMQPKDRYFYPAPRGRERHFLLTYLRLSGRLLRDARRIPPAGAALRGRVCLVQVLKKYSL
jgi:hypothetical protein